MLARVADKLNGGPICSSEAIHLHHASMCPGMTNTSQGAGSSTGDNTNTAGYHIFNHKYRGCKHHVVGSCHIWMGGSITCLES